MSDDVNLLIVDDDDVDVQGLKRTLKEANLTNSVTVARDGIEALQILRGEKDCIAPLKPYIILLDLNMPRMNGIEFLEEVRADQQLKKSVVFMLSTSSSEQDIDRAYQHHVAGFIVKRNAAQNLVDALSMLARYWRTVELPM